MNKIIIGGIVGKDAQERTGKDGRVFFSFSVATNERYQDGNDWKEKVTWHTVNVSAKFLLTRASKIKKGDRVYIVGRQYINSERNEAINKIIQYPYIDPAEIDVIHSGRNNHDNEHAETGKQQQSSMADDLPF